MDKHFYMGRKRYMYVSVEPTMAPFGWAGIGQDCEPMPVDHLGLERIPVHQKKRCSVQPDRVCSLIHPGEFPPPCPENEPLRPMVWNKPRGMEMQGCVWFKGSLGVGWDDPNSRVVWF